MLEVPLNLLKLETAAAVGAGLMETMLDEFKRMEKSWPEMNEEEQDRLIQRCRDSVYQAITTAITTIEAQDRPKLVAEVEQVVFKDGVKVVLKALNTEASHAIANKTGSYVLVLITDTREYMEGTEDIHGESDQRDAFEDNEAA